LRDGGTDASVGAAGTVGGGCDASTVGAGAGTVDWLAGCALAGVAAASTEEPDTPAAGADEPELGAPDVDEADDGLAGGAKFAASAVNDDCGSATERRSKIADSIVGIVAGGAVTGGAAAGAGN